MERVEFHQKNPNKRDLERLAEKINKGAIVVFPTDTIYALGCIMTNKSSIEKVIKLSEKREKQAKLSLICHDIKAVADYTLPYNNHIFKSMKRYLPGPYTFILNANTSVTKFFKNNKREIGIRIPDNEITLGLLEFLDAPLISTSMNMHDTVYTDPDTIEEKFQHSVDFMLDGGKGTDYESTVLDCTDEDITIIRQGVGEID